MKIEINRWNQILIEDEICEVLKEFDVLHCGWEQDSKGYIVKRPRKKKLVIILTDHGKPYEATCEDLFNKVEEYKQAINATENAMHWVLHSGGKK